MTSRSLVPPVTSRLPADARPHDSVEPSVGLNEQRFLWLYAALMVLRAGSLFLHDLSRIVPALAVVEVLVAVAALVSFRRPISGSFYQRPLAFLVAQATIVGAIYCVQGGNTASRWVVYTGLGASWIAALYAGRTLGSSLHPASLIRLFMLTAMSDVFMVVPRLTALDLNRTSFGYTHLMFGIVILSVLTIVHRSTRIAAVPLIVLGLVATLMTGMRSCLTFTFFSLALAVLYLVRLRRARLTTLGPRLLFGLVLALPCAAVFASLTSAMETHVEIVQRRLEATVLNEDFKLDEDVTGSREDEVDRSLSEFYDRADSDEGAWVWGFGHGFVYDNGTEITAHVHITPIAFFVRCGVIGVALYGIMFLLCAGSTVRAWFRPASNWNAINLSFQLAALLYWINSLVGGVLVYPDAWIIIGIADAMTRRPQMDL